jgi:hypothetical protein
MGAAMVSPVQNDTSVENLSGEFFQQQTTNKCFFSTTVSR